MNNNENNNLNNIGTNIPNIPTNQQPTIMFDPMTGQQISQPTNNTQVGSEIPVQSIDSAIQIQNELQAIPTVEQGSNAFINNVQSMNQEKKEEKKEGVNFVFIIILFIIILATILFLFPLLLDYI